MSQAVALSMSLQLLTEMRSRHFHNQNICLKSWLPQIFLEQIQKQRPTLYCELQFPKVASRYHRLGNFVKLEKTKNY